MPASYLSRHRPICAVLAEIQELVRKDVDGDNQAQILALCDEAIDYARRMSVALTNYKAEVSARSPV